MPSQNTPKIKWRILATVENKIRLPMFIFSNGIDTYKCHLFISYQQIRVENEALFYLQKRWLDF